MAIAVLVIVVGVIVGVTIELLLSRRQRARRIGDVQVDLGVEVETLKPLPPRPPEPRFIDDGEGFRIIGPLDYDGPDAAPWESDEPNAPEEGP